MPNHPPRLFRTAVSTGALIVGWTARASGDSSSEPAPTVVWTERASAVDSPGSGDDSPESESEPASSHLTIKERGRLTQNSVFFEAFGAGFLYSLNYERMVLDQLGVRVGAGFLPVHASTAASGQERATSYSGLLTCVPITVSYVGVRSGRHALELGGGLSLLYWSGMGSSGPSLIPLGGVAMAGYRYHPLRGPGGLMFRAGVEALVGPLGQYFGNLGVLPWPYLSAGSSF